jgi:hypothetical protein
MRSFKKIAVVLMTFLMIFTSTVTIAAEDETYTATYQFVMDDGSSLPDEVKARLPKARMNLKDGDVITNDPIEDIEIGDYVYVFIGWSEESVIVDGGDMHFVGTWSKTQKSETQKDELEPELPQQIETDKKDETDKPSETKPDTDPKEDEKEEETTGEVAYTARYVFAEASGRRGINNLPDEIMALLPEDEEVMEGVVYVPKEPAHTEVLGYEFHGYEPITKENGDVVYQGIWYQTGNRGGLLKAGPLRAGSHSFGYLGQQNWGLAANNGYNGHNGFSIDGNPSFCLDGHTPLSEIGTAYDDLGSDDSGLIGIIAMGLMNGRSQAECQAAVWNAQGITATVNGVYIDPNDDDFQSHGAYGYSADLYGGSGLQTQASGVSWWPLGGFVKVYKKAAETTFNYVANCPNNYSLSGAVYGIYSDANCTNQVATVTTGNGGESPKSSVLDPGTYYVKEKTPSLGFEIDTNVYPVSVTAGNTSSITSTEVPLNDPVYVNLYKQDRRGNTRYDINYADYLDEAQFTLKYFDAQTNDTSSLTPKYTWVFGSHYNASGKVVCNFDLDDLISGPNPETLGLIKNGDFYLPLGTFTIEESTSPTLYAADPNTYVGHIKAPIGGIANETVDHYIDKEGTVNELTDENGSWMVWLDVDNLWLGQNEELQTITLNVQKHDAESGTNEVPEGDEDMGVTDTATLEGAVFHVYRTAYYSNDDGGAASATDRFPARPQWVELDEANYIDYGTITTDATGLATLKYERKDDGSGNLIDDTENGLLPGKFKIVEETAPNGYALWQNGEATTYSVVDYDSSSADKDGTGNEYRTVCYAPLAATNPEFNTADFAYTLNMSNKLTRIQVTKVDQDGNYIPLSAQAVLGLVEESTGNIVYRWTYDGENHPFHIIRGLTAQISYLLRELSVDPHYRLATERTVNPIDVDDHELHTKSTAGGNTHQYQNYYTMVDHEITVATQAHFNQEGKKEWDNQDEKHYVADGVHQIIDEVAIKNCYEGNTYKLVGELWDITDPDNPVSLNNTAEATFTPEYDVMIYQYLNFDQQLDDLDNHTIVVYETLYDITDGTEKLVTEHKDNGDTKQMVYVDELYRRDFELLKVNADDETEVLEGFKFNIKTYRVKRDGVVEDVDLGEFTTDADGKINIEKIKEDCKITVTETAAADPTWYVWEEPFYYDIGHDATIVEALNAKIVDHKIKIGTYAIYEDTGDKDHEAEGETNIVDRVDYEWLYKNKDYKLVATLIDKGTAESPSETQITTVEHEFKPENTNGSEEVKIAIDPGLYPSHSFVVFEELYVKDGSDWAKVAEHKELDDADQTVYVDSNYRCLMVMYKTNETKTIRLNGGVFTVTARRTRKDGTTGSRTIGRFVTGGIYYEQEEAFTYKIAKDEAMSEVVSTLTSSKHSKFGTQYIQTTDLEPGIYYGQVEGSDEVRVHHVAKGMIYLPDMPADSDIVYHEEIAPEGYYLPGDDFVANVGHDDTVTRIENERPNTRIIHRGGNIPKTGYDGNNN